MLAERSKINLKDQLCPILPNTNLITLQASERVDKDTYFSNCLEKEIIAKIPSTFWRSIPIFNIPSNFRHRKNIITEALDLNHYKTCKSAKFHTSYKDEECICINCDNILEMYHGKYFECNPFINFPTYSIFVND